MVLSSLPWVSVSRPTSVFHTSRSRRSAVPPHPARPQAPELLLLALDTLPSSDTSGTGGEVCGQHFRQY